MGREAECACSVNGERFAVKALLETNELILRGGFRRRIPFSEMSEIAGAGDELRFVSGVDRFALHLGKSAPAWAAKITSPPTLAKKLGVSASCKAFVIGTCSDDVALSDALDGATTEVASEAGMVVAVVSNATDLDHALDAHARLPRPLHLWIVHGKGRSCTFGENDVRAIMRGGGYMDTKVAGVSDRFSATRYSVPKSSGGELENSK